MGIYRNKYGMRSVRGTGRFTEKVIFKQPLSAKTKPLTWEVAGPEGAGGWVSTAGESHGRPGLKRPLEASRPAVIPALPAHH